MEVALPAAGLVLAWLLLRVFVGACKQRLGIKRAAPNWIVFARLFPATFPRVVAFVWSCIGCIPCSVLIALHGYVTRWSRKAVWTFAHQPGSEGMVALTLDDAPARVGGMPMMREVLEVLAEFDATCSFFTVTTFCEGREEMMREAVRQGHEVCNHGGKDIAYHKHSKEDFRKVLLDCERTVNACLHAVNEESTPPIGAVNRRNNKWFRPPRGVMSPAMAEVLEVEGFRIAMSDCYGMDVMCRPPFIANYTARHARHGTPVDSAWRRVPLSAPFLTVAPPELDLVDNEQGRSCCCTCQRSGSESTTSRAFAIRWLGSKLAGYGVCLCRSWSNPARRHHPSAS
jgi:peptidoglycan/xylan/chitin deacetylase (PgdA/CDA1 family)